MLTIDIVNTAAQKLCLFIFPSKLIILVQKSIKKLSPDSIRSGIVLLFLPTNNLLPHL